MRNIKSAYSRTRVSTSVDPDRKTRALQSERNSSDINNIVAKAYQTGQMPVLMGRKHIPDLPDSATYQDMLNKVVFAQQQFERLPSSIRSEFDNKPEKMLYALELSRSDDKIKSQLQSLGILEQDKAPSAPTTQGQEPLSAPANE